MTNLPDVTFAEGDVRVLAEKLKTFYEAVRRAAGEPAYRLGDADPVRLIQLSESALLAQVNADIDATGKGNLLYYAGEETIEHLGYLYGERGNRIQPAAAGTTIRYTLSAARSANTVIPAGSRVTPDNKVFFATESELEIPAGQLTGDVLAVCLTPGTVGNGFAAGEIKNIVDRVPFVAEAVNTKPSAGGTDLEDIEAYRARLQLLPESFSVAGPEGAYEFWAKTASSDIIDVAVWSPAPVEVNVVPLMRSGELPTDEMLDLVYETLNGKDRRPMTDLVHVLKPTTVNYSIEVRYWVSTSDAGNVSTIQSNVQAAVNTFINWQGSKLGRDINPSVLHQRIMEAGAKRAEITEPAFVTLDHDQVAVSGMPNIMYEGVEDG